MLFGDARHNDSQIIREKIELLQKNGRYCRFNLSKEAYEKAEEIYKALTPMTAVGHDKIRLGAENDGGYIFLDNFLRDGAKFAYSFGISSYDPFSLDMMAYGYDVWQYDGTIEGPPYNHPRIHFKPFNISGEEYPRPNERNLRRIIEENGHRDATDIILQCDIEGCEWSMLENARTEDLIKFTQINIEFHDLHPFGNAWLRKLRLLKKLNETHQITHIHANNAGGYTILKN